MFLEYKYCYECCRETNHHNGKCSICVAAESKRRYKQHFANLDAMTLEERVRLIEKTLYKMSINPPWIEPTY